MGHKSHPAAKSHSSDVQPGEGLARAVTLEIALRGIWTNNIGSIRQMQKLRLRKTTRLALWLPEDWEHGGGGGDIFGSLVHPLRDEFGPPQQPLSFSGGRARLAHYHGNGCTRIPGGWLAVSKAPSRGAEGSLGSPGS